jgi:TetR/AcrR family transcriptional regulator
METKTSARERRPSKRNRAKASSVQPARKARARRPETGKRKVRTRDAERTRGRLLRAAIHEFAQHGYSGARIDRIVLQARCNTRMAYHYFGSKTGMYLAALESVYEDIRTKEQALKLADVGPIEGMLHLVEFTLDHFANNPDFIRLTSSENNQRGRFIQASKRIPTMASPLIEQIRELLRAGVRVGEFRRGIDPLQLYITIVALSCHHLNNSYTLSTTFKTDVTSQSWQRLRKVHVRDLVLSYLQVKRT